MNASNAYPYHLRWNAQDIADAVPLRLFELFDIDAVTPRAQASNAPKPRAWRGAYRTATPLPLRMRIHN